LRASEGISAERVVRSLTVESLLTEMAAATNDEINVLLPEPVVGSRGRGDQAGLPVHGDGIGDRIVVEHSAGAKRRRQGLRAVLDPLQDGVVVRNVLNRSAQPLGPPDADIAGRRVQKTALVVHRRALGGRAGHWL